MIDTVEDAQGPELILTHKLGNEETQDRHILDPTVARGGRGLTHSKFLITSVRVKDDRVKVWEKGSVAHGSVSRWALLASPTCPSLLPGRALF